ncbi:MAG: hypothetical protein ACM3JJ_03460 [Hyphomicrobiales bacterium]
MFRHTILLASLVVLLSLGAVPARAQTQYVGPTQILLVKADSVAIVRTAEWLSAKTRDQEKLLLTSLRMKFWRDHLPGDMRRVYDALGYPTGRVLLTPVGHTEEWWYYGQLAPPLRFRDGVLLDESYFETLRGR